VCWIYGRRSSIDAAFPRETRATAAVTGAMSEEKLAGSARLQWKQARSNSPINIADIAALTGFSRLWPTFCLPSCADELEARITRGMARPVYMDFRFLFWTALGYQLRKNGFAFEIH
jgi:hypothetical protein